MPSFVPPLPLSVSYQPSFKTCRRPKSFTCTYSHATPNGTSNGTDISTSSPSMEAVTRPVTPSELKSELYALASTTNRGLSATPSQRSQILSLISELESTIPCTNPVDSSLLPGRWRLLFTDALDVLSLSLLSPWALIGDIYQNVYEVPPNDRKDFEFQLENIVLLQPPFASVTNAFWGENVTELKVKARGKRKNDRRIDITFVSSALRVTRVLGRDVPTEIPPLQVSLLSPVGFIDTTVLDEDLRVARSPPNTGKTEGNVFVLLREQ